MHPSKKFAFDVGITFLASVVTLPLVFVIRTSKRLIKLFSKVLEDTLVQTIWDFTG